ncbi:hypothetical protein AGMMS50268_41060 [Spirochaetia bacterium]|nr:hypothetical protein AGMMS50268_41060 [Spirochaetia bacterium]
MEFIEQKYNFSFLKSLKAIKWFSWLLFIIAIVEILALEFNFGIKILNDQFSNIISQICYVFFTSFIFYYIVEILPSLKKEYYQNEIVRKKMGALGISYQVSIDQINEYTPLKDLYESYKDSSIDKNEQYKIIISFDVLNLELLGTILDNILEEINNILSYKSIINEELLLALESIIVRIKYLKMKGFYKEEAKEKVEVIENYCLHYQRFLNMLKEITKEYR